MNEANRCRLLSVTRLSRTFYFRFEFHKGLAADVQHLTDTRLDGAKPLSLHSHFALHHSGPVIHDASYLGQQILVSGSGQLLSAEISIESFILSNSRFAFITIREQGQREASTRGAILRKGRGKINKEGG